MEFGVAIPQWGRWADPQFIRDYSAHAEHRGFDGLWAVDHIVMPRRIDSLYPLGNEAGIGGEHIDAVHGGKVVLLEQPDHGPEEEP